MKQQQAVLEFQLTPFNVLLRAVLSQLQEKDKYSIFAQPVNTKEVCGLPPPRHTRIHTCHSTDVECVCGSSLVVLEPLLSGGTQITNRFNISCRFLIIWTT